MSVILNRRESATVIAGLRLLAGDTVRVPNYPDALMAGLCDETDPEYELRHAGTTLRLHLGTEKTARRTNVWVQLEMEIGRSPLTEYSSAILASEG